MRRLVLLRHGQSQWNLENRFTGWTDVALSEHGREEARKAGELMLKAGILPEVAFTSYLRRAISTLWIVLEAVDRQWIPVRNDWHLNERHYGALQGLNKADTAAKYGDSQVHEWRRGFDVLPPLLTPDDPRFPGHDPRYKTLTRDELPLAESLQDTIARVRCCWEEYIVPSLANASTVLVAAHGNSLRGLVMMIRHLTAQEIVDVEMPTGKPWVFTLDERLEVTENFYL
ncbi:MAG: 2,3-diphosphoglycerate-dependent phosphoglycerate mutase [Muribaculaceae bacterium]|nr:2,3-diphosphoglycerate-dependent phosphoglycerate mutase [Muribaculaceae bacterium]